MRRSAFTLVMASSLLAVSGMFAPSAAAPAVVPAQPKKQLKAVKRQKTAEAVDAPKYRRSKNPPTRRKLRANRLHISKRVRRKHRRAA